MTRRVQCKACPWRVDVDPAQDIPGGYSVEKHCGLQDTIADGTVNVGPELRLIACHESKSGAEFVCVGWLHNQLGVGNNMALRIRAIEGKLPRYELVGEQHQTFEDTLP